MLQLWTKDPGKCPKGTNFQRQSRALMRVLASVAAVRCPVVRCSDIRIASSLCAHCRFTKDEGSEQRMMRELTSVQEVKETRLAAGPHTSAGHEKFSSGAVFACVTASQGEVELEGI